MHSQKWWFDQKTKTIRNNAFPGKSLEIAGSGKSSKLQLWTTSGKWW